MWNDVKKLGGLLYNQTWEQKDILLLKLRIVSYSNKRESAQARLGGFVYNVLKSGKTGIDDDKDIQAEVENLDGIGKEIEEANKKIEELRVKTAGERGEISEEIGKAWEKTKTQISYQKPDEPKPPPKDTQPPSKTTKSEKAAPKKKPKRISKENGGEKH
ncbi:MAG: hypothetical protein IEMM0002_0648 [bacterium]|nr:MAG: hypothetical protein IEMM0002_0648 [bacterium]